MKRYFLVLVVILGLISVKAQSVDYNKIILPSKTQDVEIAERLVQLAWQNNPQNSIVKNNVTIAEKQLNQAKVFWLGKIRIAGNVNEFTLDPENARSEFYPRYNFGLMFTLDDFTNGAAIKKISQAQLLNAQEEVNSQKLAIRGEVLRRYEIYKLNLEKFKIQNEATEDAYSNYLRTEQRFKNGEIDMVEFNRSTSLYNSEKINKLTVESELSISKINLEELIGVDLDEVM